MTKQLSPRQLEYVQHLRDGLSDKQIAQRMGITPGSARLYAHRIHEKLEVTNRVEVLMHCLRDGLISLCLLASVAAQTVDVDAIRNSTRTNSKLPRAARNARRSNGRLRFDLLDDLTNGSAAEYLSSYDVYPGSARHV
jgi:DNA-binding CsgD family transcriptional regulator